MSRGTLIVMRGLPGSGKSTYAKTLVSVNRAVRVNRDDLRMMLFGKDRGLNFSQESEVTEASQSLVKLFLGRGYTVVVDDMNLRPRYVRQWRKIAESTGATFAVKEMHIDLELCVKRDSERPNHVGEDVIRMLAAKFLSGAEYLQVPNEELPDRETVRPYVAPSEAPPAIIVDIDGTVALKGDRDIYDLTRVGEDSVNEDVADLVREMGMSVGLIFMSGREETCREQTEAWLNEHFGECYIEGLFMRPEGDKRRDSIVKAELFNKHIRHNYDVWFVLDDRNQVVQMWRDMGLTCLQVADGNF